MMVNNRYKLLENDYQDICSVAELAEKLGLSRARFYQLQKMGVFPMPVYCIHTRRPFYPLDLQQKCLQIRKTGIGHNGHPVIFYRTKKDKAKKSYDQQDQNLKELCGILKQMGLSVTYKRLKVAVAALYPKGLTDRPIEAAVIRDLFGYFRNKCTNDV